MREVEISTIEPDTQTIGPHFKEMSDLDSSIILGLVLLLVYIAAIPTTNEGSDESIE